MVKWYHCQPEKQKLVKLKIPGLWSHPNWIALAVLFCPCGAFLPVSGRPSASYSLGNCLGVQSSGTVLPSRQVSQLFYSGLELTLHFKILCTCGEVWEDHPLSLILNENISREHILQAWRPRSSSIINSSHLALFFLLTCARVVDSGPMWEFNDSSCHHSKGDLQNEKGRRPMAELTSEGWAKEEIAKSWSGEAGEKPGDHCNNKLKRISEISLTLSGAVRWELKRICWVLSLGGPCWPWPEQCQRSADMDSGSRWVKE